MIEVLSWLYGAFLIGLLAVAVVGCGALAVDAVKRGWRGERVPFWEGLGGKDAHK